MKILLALTYYKPNVSGLTIYSERLANGLVARGHEVTILASQHDSSVPAEETEGGVRIVRAPVAARVSKGVIMPSLGRIAGRLMSEADVVNLHLPMFDAAGLALRARLAHKPLVLTYHCDLQLPDGRANRIVDNAVYAANYTAAKLADRIVAYTDDYAQHSRLLKRFPGKIEVIPPPVAMKAAEPADLEVFRTRHDLAGRIVLGYASRFAAEKGIEVLVNALPELIQQHPNLKVLFAGPYREVIGEEEYRARLDSRIAALGDRWKFIGTLSAGELPAFYTSLDLLLMTSLNATESFGLVQVESMLCGTPVVASDLPGVRQPVLTTGMGVISPPGDSGALAQAIRQVLGHPQRYWQPRNVIERTYDSEQSVAGYEKLLSGLIVGKTEQQDE